MSNEAARLLEQVAVLEMEIETRVVMHTRVVNQIMKHIEAGKIACGYSAASPSTSKWSELEKSVSVGTLVAILELLTESKSSIPDFVEAWQMHGDVRLALLALCKPNPAAGSRFNPANN